MRKFLLPSLIVLGFLASACDSISGTQAPQEAVQIGTILPLTGALGSKGPSRKKAAELAIMHINEAGGIDGLPLEAFHGDSATDASQAAAEADKLLQDHPEIQILIGASSSSVSEAVLEVTQPTKRLMISPSSTSPLFSDLADDDRFFRTAPSDEFQGCVLATKMLDFEYKTAAIIHIEGTYGESLKSVIKENFEKKSGHRVLAEVSYSAEESGDFNSQIQALFKEEVEAVAFIGYPAEASKIFNAWLKSGLNPNVKWFLSDGLKAVEIIQGVTEPQKLDQLIGTIPLSIVPGQKQFQTDYAQTYGEFPVSFAPHTYDATVMAALALQRSRVGDKPDLRDALRAISRPPGIEIGPGTAELKKGLDLLKAGKEIDYQGASGDVNLDENGDVLSDYEIWTLKNGFILQAETVPIELIKSAERKAESQ